MTFFLRNSKNIFYGIFLVALFLMFTGFVFAQTEQETLSVTAPVQAQQDLVEESVENPAIVPSLKIPVNVVSDPVIRITGENFTDDLFAYFDDDAELPTTVRGGTELTITIPKSLLSVGLHSISVANSFGSSDPMYIEVVQAVQSKRRAPAISVVPPVVAEPVVEPVVAESEVALTSEEVASPTPLVQEEQPEPKIVESPVAVTREELASPAESEVQPEAQLEEVAVIEEQEPIVKQPPTEEEILADTRCGKAPASEGVVSAITDFFGFTSAKDRQVGVENVVSSFVSTVKNGDNLEMKQLCVIRKNFYGASVINLNNQPIVINELFGFEVAKPQIVWGLAYNLENQTYSGILGVVDNAGTAVAKYVVDDIFNIENSTIDGVSIASLSDVEIKKINSSEFIAAILPADVSGQEQEEQLAVTPQEELVQEEILEFKEKEITKGDRCVKMSIEDGIVSAVTDFLGFTKKKDRTLAVEEAVLGFATTVKNGDNLEIKELCAIRKVFDGNSAINLNSEELSINNLFGFKVEKPQIVWGLVYNPKTEITSGILGVVSTGETLVANYVLDDIARIENSTIDGVSIASLSDVEIKKINPNSFAVAQSFLTPLAQEEQPEPKIVESPVAVTREELAPLAEPEAQLEEVAVIEEQVEEQKVEEIDKKKEFLLSTKCGQAQQSGIVAAVGNFLGGLVEGDVVKNLRSLAPAFASIVEFETDLKMQQLCAIQKIQDGNVIINLGAGQISVSDIADDQNAAPFIVFGDLLDEATESFSGVVGVIDVNNSVARYSFIKDQEALNKVMVGDISLGDLVLGNIEVLNFVK